MKSLSSKYILYLVLINVILITSLILYRSFLFQEIQPIAWMGGAIVFFFLYEIMLILVTDKKSKTITPRQSVNLFLGLKVGKILLSLLFVTIYAISVKLEMKRFVLFFVLLYLVYLLFDTIYLAKREKK
jgi:hypothetical protein